jgi:hypothetical protein
MGLEKNTCEQKLFFYLENTVKFAQSFEQIAQTIE